jgi:hypothetical protein
MAVAQGGEEGKRKRGEPVPFKKFDSDSREKAALGWTREHSGSTESLVGEMEEGTKSSLIRPS